MDGSPDFNHVPETSMTFLKTTLAASTAVLITTGAWANEAPASLNLDDARTNVSFDLNADGTVAPGEIIKANATFFDCDDNGFLDAQERFQAADVLAQNVSVVNRSDLVAMPVVSIMPLSELEFDAQSARLNPSFDADRDGLVSNEELILANLSEFDMDGDGQINAIERLTAKEYLIRM